jgi:glycosyltransferase involved in cell wall biosynthesis
MTADEQRLAGPVAGHVPSAVVPPGVDDAYMSEPIVAPGARDLRVAALTRLHPVKRLDALIRGFHALAADPACATWQLTIAGDGEPGYRAGLERLAAEGPAAARISFAGWIDGEAKRQWLRTAAVFALPSHQENFGLGLIEALACGVPAIVSTGVNLSPAVEAAGAGWVVGNDEAALVGALTEAISDADRRARRSHAARGLASRFTWAESARQLESLYGSLRQPLVASRV